MSPILLHSLQVHNYLYFFVIFKNSYENIKLFGHTFFSDIFVMISGNVQKEMMSNSVMLLTVLVFFNVVLVKIPFVYIQLKFVMG